MLCILRLLRCCKGRKVRIGPVFETFLVLIMVGRLGTSLMCRRAKKNIYFFFYLDVLRLMIIQHAVMLGDDFDREYVCIDN